MEIDTLVYGVNNVQTMKPTMVGFLFGSFLLTQLAHDVILKAKLNTQEHSMKVFVYFNLHKKVFSVRAMEGENKGRVIAHTTTVELRDAVFKVSQAGRERVLKEKRKNVHAGVQGQWVAWTGVNSCALWPVRPLTISSINQQRKNNAAPAVVVKN